jgi:hypothetical protein
MASSSFQVVRKKKHKEKKNHREEKTCKEGKELTFKLLLCLLTFDFRFRFLILHFHFKCFILTFSFYQVEGKKKTTEKKKMQKKGRSLPSNSYFALSLLALVFAFSLLHFYFKRFLLVSSFSQAKKKQCRKKNP